MVCQIDVYYCKKLGNLFTILGKFIIFFNWEGPVFGPKY